MAGRKSKWAEQIRLWQESGKPATIVVVNGSRIDAAYAQSSFGTACKVRGIKAVSKTEQSGAAYLITFRQDVLDECKQAESLKVQDVIHCQRLVWLKAAAIAEADKFYDLAEWFKRRAEIQIPVTPRDAGVKEASNGQV